MDWTLFLLNQEVGFFIFFQAALFKGGKMEKKKILIVEDEHDMRTLLTLHLGTSGYDIFIASDGQEGLEETMSVMPDLIILDLMLPRVGGYEVCTRLKSDKRFSHIPILIFSARVEDIDKNFGLQCGANDYMFKPFDEDFLLERIQKLLGDTPDSSLN